MASSRFHRTHLDYIGVLRCCCCSVSSFLSWIQLGNGLRSFLTVILAAIYRGNRKRLDGTPRKRIRSTARSKSNWRRPTNGDHQLVSRLLCPLRSPWGTHMCRPYGGEKVSGGLERQTWSPPLSFAPSVSSPRFRPLRACQQFFKLAKISSVPRVTVEFITYLSMEMQTIDVSCFITRLRMPMLIHIFINAIKWYLSRNLFYVLNIIPRYHQSLVGISITCLILFEISL